MGAATTGAGCANHLGSARAGVIFPPWNVQFKTKKFSPGWVLRPLLLAAQITWTRSGVIFPTWNIFFLFCTATDLAKFGIFCNVFFFFNTI